MAWDLTLVSPGHPYSTAEWATGLYKALVAREDVNVYPVDLHSLIKFYTMALPAVSPSFPTFAALCQDDDMFHRSTVSLASDRIITSILEQWPDVVVFIHGMLVSSVIYTDYLPKLGIPWGVIFTESPYEDETQSIIRDLAHFATVNDRGTYERWQGCGTPVEYLGAGYDAEVWQPQEAEYEYDWSFVGTQWPERVQLIERLQRLERPHYLLWAGGQPDGTLEFLSHSELVELYARTKVVINMHRSSVGLGGQRCEHAGYSLNPRAYEIAACGAFQVSDERPELQEMFGDCIPTYADADELAEQVIYWADHDSEREAQASIAHRRVAGHTYAERAGRLIEFIDTLLLGG